MLAGASSLDGARLGVDMLKRLPTVKEKTLRLAGPRCLLHMPRGHRKLPQSFDGLPAAQELLAEVYSSILGPY